MQFMQWGSENYDKIVIIKNTLIFIWIIQIIKTPSSDHTQAYTILYFTF